MTTISTGRHLALAATLGGLLSAGVVALGFWLLSLGRPAPTTPELAASSTALGPSVIEERPEAVIEEPVSAALLRARLEEMDALVARLRGRMPAERVAALEARYAGLYSAVNESEGTPALAAVAERIREFREEIAALQ